MVSEPTERCAHPVRVLRRGLELLVALNHLQRASINRLASTVRLPRTTTFRILETLRAAGYIVRDAEDDCYRPAIGVRTLSDGFDDETRAARVAKPLLAALSAEIVWPLAIATAAGTSMVIRESSDNHSPLPLERFSVGMRMPMLSTAAGRAYLAHCSTAQRDALLELLSRSSLPADRLARSHSEVERLLRDTRSQGFGMARRERRVSDEMSLALPLRIRDRLLATLAIRYVANAVPLRAAVEQFLPKMRALVQAVETQMAQGAAGNRPRISSASSV